MLQTVVVQCDLYSALGPGSRKKFNPFSGDRPWSGPILGVTLDPSTIDVFGIFPHGQFPD
ncbi:hypothetical protein IQ219_08470 [Synechocystis sp. LEGE 06083]|nr:hypothetical protein [Synechocystis sp. LEGE 06083]